MPRAGATADTTLSAVRDELVCERRCIAEQFLLGVSGKPPPKNQHHDPSGQALCSPGTPMEFLSQSSFHDKRWVLIQGAVECYGVAILTGLMYSGRAPPPSGFSAHFVRNTTHMVVTARALF